MSRVTKVLNSTGMVPIISRPKMDKCYFCRNSIASKYTVEIEDSVISPAPFTAYVCGTCLRVKSDVSAIDNAIALNKSIEAPLYI